MAAVLSLAGHSRAIADVLHFARAHERIVLLDRSVVPPGGEFAVKYDGGDRWIPYFVSSIPSIPKSAASLVEEVVFDPPIEGVTTKLTPFYMRTNYPNSIATHVIPNDHGDVLAKSTKVRISFRLGDYYLIATKPGLPPYIPVSAITVPQASLSTGTVPPVPEVPSPSSAPAVRNPPVPGPLFAKLKVPYTLDGLALSEGQYIQIRYNGGDDWVVDGGNGGDEPRISKDAVDLVEHINYFTPLGGKVTTPTTVYKYLVNPRDHATLEQSESFSNMNVRLKAGEEVTVDAKEGDDYVVRFSGHGPNNLGRVPVNDIEIVAGNPAGGTPVEIPPKPQSKNPSAQGYTPPPPKESNVFTDYVIPAAIISVIAAIAGGIFRYQSNHTPGAGEVSYGVPHTKFKKLENGFRVTFVRDSEAFYVMTHLQSQMKSPNGFAALFFVIIMAALLLFMLLWYGIESFFRTVIVIDRESVTINGKRMKRGDFGTFAVLKAYSNDKGEAGVLGYQLGNRSFPFGGVWNKGKGLEVASALNASLRAAWRAADPRSAPPIQTVAAGATEF